MFSVHFTVAMKFCCCVSILLLFSVSFAYRKRYDGYQVFEMTPETKASLKYLMHLYNERSEEFDFWKEPSGIGKKVDIMVPPGRENSTGFSQMPGLTSRIKIRDVQSINQTEASSSIKEVLSSSSLSFNWTAYHDFPVIEEFIDHLVNTYPKWVTVNNTGKTYHGKSMSLVKISSGEEKEKNAIFIDGGIHAREWIAPAVVTWIMYELLQNYTAHPQYIDNVDWYFMPIINPDGYHYSHTEDRLWRKNRAPTNDSNCIGVDLNRNFGYHWAEGELDTECLERYHGSSAFSELETRNVRDAILSVADQVKVYLNFHSYGQIWTYPWGYTTNLTENHQQLEDLAVNATRRLEAIYGTKYTVGPLSKILYQATGGSIDWVKGSTDIPYCYTIELRDENGTFGFELPVSQIIPTAEETWEAVKTVAEAVIDM